MKVKVSGKTIELFQGAKVRHALMRYFTMKGLEPGLADCVTVFDGYGHETDGDAPLHDGQVIKYRTPKTKR